jgi:hypothetical protein
VAKDGERWQNQTEQMPPDSGIGGSMTNGGDGCRRNRTTAVAQPRRSRSAEPELVGSASQSARPFWIARTSSSGVSPNRMTISSGFPSGWAACDHSTEERVADVADLTPARAGDLVRTRAGDRLETRIAEGGVRGDGGGEAARVIAAGALPTAIAAATEPRTGRSWRRSSRARSQPRPRRAPRPARSPVPHVNRGDRLAGAEIDLRDRAGAIVGDPDHSFPDGECRRPEVQPQPPSHAARFGIDARPMRTLASHGRYARRVHG